MGMWCALFGTEVENFSDPMVDCRESKQRRGRRVVEFCYSMLFAALERFRADQLMWAKVEEAQGSRQVWRGL